MRRAYKNSYVQSQKMLASTVQFSTYDQTPPTRPRQTRPSHGRSGGTRTGEPCQRSTVARSLRTQQRAYDPAPQAIRFHTPPR